MKIVSFFLLLIWVSYTNATNYENTSKQEKIVDTLNMIKFDVHKVEAIKHRLRMLNRVRRNSPVKCGANLTFDVEKKHCCKMCPKGEYVQTPCSTANRSPICVPCKSGTYLQFQNYEKKCKMCTNCDPVTHEILRNCSITRNTECSCKKGRYKELGGHCFLCTKCINRETIKNCTENENTRCGSCLPGYYEDKRECLPCAQTSQKLCGNKTDEFCFQPCEPRVTNLPIAYIVTGLGLLLLLPVVALVIYQQKRKKEKVQKYTLKECNKLVDNFIDPGVLVKEDSSNTAQGQLTSVLQKASTLYDIIDVVPARRWKEFMRTLELQDKEIELVEIEFVSFRDQQYEMLRRWCQIKTTTIETIFCALEKMNLSGCAEELRRKIEHYV